MSKLNQILETQKNLPCNPTLQCSEGHQAGIRLMAMSISGRLGNDIASTSQAVEVLTCWAQNLVGGVLSIHHPDQIYRCVRNCDRSAPTLEQTKLQALRVLGTYHHKSIGVQPEGNGLAIRVQSAENYPPSEVLLQIGDIKLIFETNLDEVASMFETISTQSADTALVQKMAGVAIQGEPSDWSSLARNLRL